MTSPSETRERLIFAHKASQSVLVCLSSLFSPIAQLLDVCRLATSGDDRSARILSRYDSMIAARRERSAMEARIWHELVSLPILFEYKLLKRFGRHGKIVSGIDPL